MLIQGKYNKAKIFTNVIEQTATEQILAMCDSPVFKGTKIRIMPDVHTGSGCTIGTTMTIKNKVVPNMVGVDIGCGMEVVEIAESEIDLKTLDEFIYANIPSGLSCRETYHEYTDKINLKELACVSKVDIERGYLSLGSLGGGNHFIEVDKDSNGKLYLVVHSGSRHIGLEVAEFYQKAAKKYHAFEKMKESDIINKLKSKGKEREIQKTLDALRKKYALVADDDFSMLYVEGELFDNYIHDMKIMQKFAALNRRAMTDQILKGLNLSETGRFTTVHNYIDTDAMILRKGAVSAKKGERLLIPINMRDGSLICMGKGKADWNFSAPHGAGRLMSRGKAKQVLTLDEFENQMKGIYSTSINLSTLDESPMAYKSLEDIVSNIVPTVDIEKQIFPIYNFKASEDEEHKRKKSKNERTANPD